MQSSRRDFFGSTKEAQPGRTMNKISRQEETKADHILRRHIYKTYEVNAFAEEWRNLPEIPSSSEIVPPSKTLLEEADEKYDHAESWNDYQQEPLNDENLPHNIVKGPWPSKEAYIGAHYQILREDAIAPLRRSVADVKKNPGMQEDGDTCIYTHVTLKGLLLSRIGAAFRVEFSTERAGKQIRWQQSKRLLQGTVVALAPSSDMFRTNCKIAIVAARPIQGGLNQNPPTVDLFWGDSEDAVIDPVEQYVMVEARQGYFEASRHMLVAMQKLMTEKFELENHIVHLNQDVKAPTYLEEHPIMDLSSLERKSDPTLDQDTDPLVNIDVLRQFPKNMDSGMDKSQLLACEKMLTNRVAIVQGPPGTGKTFVSVSALRVMIGNLGPDDPPIVVAAQTNHALDQLLNHILSFEPNIVRLGGRCNKDNEAILKRTLYNLRIANPNIQDGRKSFRFAYIDWQKRCGEIRSALETLTTESMLTAETLRKHRIISDAQFESLQGIAGWEGEDASGADIADWLTRDQMMRVPGAPQINPELPMEEEDIENEENEELEDAPAADVSGAGDMKDEDALKGEWVPFRRQFTGRHVFPPILTDKKIKKMLATEGNLFDIPLAMRGEVYRFFEKQINMVKLRDLRARLKEYQSQVNSYMVTKGMCNIRMIRHLGIKVIGCTTTGLAKYRGLLSALRPRTLLIEEAAETLEGKVIGGLMESIEHLILVGDHQQLQAGCTVRALEAPPYNMKVSMFERLVDNSIGYVMLNKQRRMILDIRKLLCIEEKPFYEDLHDHESVLDRVHNRPPVPGMGGRDTYFFHHTWPEAANADCSRYNLSEAQMIARFFYYLCLNGVDAAKITVLTFYNGQRKTLLHELKNVNGLTGLNRFNVFTVDSYQGEENEIILLSLVRSNHQLSIGFLDNKNRLVVALSRARRGLYIFGNSLTLIAPESREGVIGREPLWNPLVTFMSKNGQFNVDGGLPLTCSRHGKVTRIYESVEFDKVLAGGCEQKCNGGVLPCGHPCPDNCHPFAHRSDQCRAACTRVLTCGHKCSRLCRDKCYCDGCCLFDNQVYVEDKTSVEFFGDSRPLGAAFGESPPKSSMKRPVSQQSAGKHVSFAEATTSVVGFSPDRRTQSSTVYGSMRPAPTTPGRSYSDPSTPSFGSRTSQPERGDPRPSAPHNQRPRSFQSPRGAFGYRTPIGLGAADARSPNSPAVQAWNAWDAKKADDDLAERRRLEDEATPKVDHSNLVFRETFRPTTFNEAGERVRVSSGSRRRVVARTEVGSDAPQLMSYGSPTPRIGDTGYLTHDETLLEGFEPYPPSQRGMSQTPKTNLSSAVNTLASGMSGASDFDNMLPAFGTDTDCLADDEQSGLSSRPKKKKKLPSTRGRGLSRPRGGASSRNRQQSLPTGELVSLQDPLPIRAPRDTAAEVASLTAVMESAWGMDDLYGASPPRSRAQRNASAPASTSPTPQRGISSAPLIDLSETSQKLNGSGEKLIDFDDN